MGLAFLLLLLIFPEAGFASATSNVEVTLPRAIELAMGQAPVRRQAVKGVALARAKLASARAAFFPRLDVSATHGFEGSSPESSSTGNRASALSLSLTETLYDNGRQWNRLRLRQEEVRKFELELRSVEQTLALDVSRAFFEFSLATHLEKVRKEQHALLEKQYQSMAKQYRQGLKTRKDYLRFKAQRQRSQVQVIATENRIRSSQAQLRQQLGFPLNLPPQTYVALSVEPTKNFGVPKARPLLENHLLFRIRQTDRRLNELTVAQARRDYWPQLTLSAGATYANQDYWGSGLRFNQTDSLRWNALVTLKWNLWDWGTQRRDLAQARLSRDISDSKLVEADLALRTTLSVLMLDLNRIRQDFKLSQELLEMETSSFGLLEEEYRRGGVPYLDLITSLKDLSNAKEFFYTSYFSLLESLANYRYHQGTLYAKSAS